MCNVKSVIHSDFSQYPIGLSFLTVRLFLSIGNAEFLERLITAAEDGDGDANVNAKDSKWLTPLHRACRQSNEVSLLLRRCFAALQFYFPVKAVHQC